MQKTLKFNIFSLIWFRSSYCFGYIYRLFLLLLHSMEWRLFLVNFLVGSRFSWQRVSTDFRVKDLGGHFMKSRFVEDIRMAKLVGEAFVFCIRFIYLFVYYLFYLLFVRLLFMSFKGAFSWIIHQLCGLASLKMGWWLWRSGGGDSGFLELYADFGRLALTYFVLLWVLCRMWLIACLLF